MFNFIEDANILSSFRMQSKKHGKIQKRKTHGFIFKIRGVTEYDFGYKKMTLNEGSVIFLPQGASYEYTSSPGDGLYTSINFQATVENHPPTIYSLFDFYSANFIFESFADLWKFGSLPDKYKCLSVFYDFLSYLARIEHLNSLDKTRHYIIEPAIEYLKSHLFDPNLKIDNLHRLCCISDTYFRRIFLSRFNLSPKEYVVSQRISHARSIIESGDFESIGEVAELVGYRDPLYFSKAFKKIYGFSPSSVNQEN